MGDPTSLNYTSKGDFTLPGEAGYEELTLRLAEKWGADVIRDSDGTQLSPAIADSGYGIYSTICLVRSVHEFLKANPHFQQQNYLMSRPVLAESTEVEIDILSGYFREQFTINTDDDPKEWWQVFDRTTGLEVPLDCWEFDSTSGKVDIHKTIPWHRYTVNFLVYRIWEEISMYNHITNNWGDKEHLSAIEPRHPEVQDVLLRYLEDWLQEHPKTTVVRFTSLFYNFAWFWGDDSRLPYIYSDWASYDFTVNPLALRQFESRYGYRPSSEDFVRGGLYNSTHNEPTKMYREWMDFTQEYVAEFGKKCVDLVHQYQKKAYVFYDDHWIGVEPYGKYFPSIGFDGIIKCVFNGFEARKCGSVPGNLTRELRLHPYLFPTGLTGEPTFSQGGNPAGDAQKYWVKIRRALLRQPVDRIGLGGYLHLVEPFPDFIDVVEKITREFHQIKELFEQGKPYTLPGSVGILTSWGSLRTWICSGHLHEHPGVYLTNVLEALAGLPFDVTFLSFDDIRDHGVPDGVKVIINAGTMGSSWSGGSNWADTNIIEILTRWVHLGGSLLGIGEPSAWDGGAEFFRLSHVFGLQRDPGNRLALPSPKIPKGEKHSVLNNLPEDFQFGTMVTGVYPISLSTQVLMESELGVQMASHSFGRGKGFYLGGFQHSLIGNNLLFRILAWCLGQDPDGSHWVPRDPELEAAFFPESNKLSVINHSNRDKVWEVRYNANKSMNIPIEPYGVTIITINS